MAESVLRIDADTPFCEGGDEYCFVVQGVGSEVVDVYVRRPSRYVLGTVVRAKPPVVLLATTGTCYPYWSTEELS